MRHPNSNVDDSYLVENVLLCAGEDPDELISVVERVAGQRPFRTYSYRCYRFWQFDRFTLIWTGIGTGCLEPLLYEIVAQSDSIKTLILIGTAGWLAADDSGGAEACETPNRKPIAYLLHEAYLGRTALSSLGNFHRKHGPSSAHRHTWSDGTRCVPRFPSQVEDLATILSTDLYYDRHWVREKAEYHGADLIDMEVAQFYCLCEIFAKNKDLNYVAIKGAANSLGNGSQQLLNSRAVLDACTRRALGLMAIDLGTTATDGTTHSAISADKLSDKLVEEIKLYWTVEIGIVTVLGVLFSQLGSQRTEPMAQFLMCFVAMVLVVVGTMYNIAGNYYTFVTRTQISGSAGDQEGIISTVMEIAFFLLSGVCGVAMGCYGSVLFESDSLSFWLSLSGLFIGLAVNVAVTLASFSGLVKASSPAVTYTYSQYVTRKWVFGRLFASLIVYLTSLRDPSHGDRRRLTDYR
ncbi:MAG: hypothetical protein ACKO38_02740 [Planctomycetota bacterium]